MKCIQRLSSLSRPYMHRTDPPDGGRPRLRRAGLPPLPGLHRQRPALGLPPDHPRARRHNQGRAPPAGGAGRRHLHPQRHPPHARQQPLRNHRSQLQRQEPLRQAVRGPRVPRHAGVRVWHVCTLFVQHGTHANQLFVTSGPRKTNNTNTNAQVLHSLHAGAHRRRRRHLHAHRQQRDGQRAAEHLHPRPLPDEHDLSPSHGGLARGGTYERLPCAPLLQTSHLSSQITRLQPANPPNTQVDEFGKGSAETDGIALLVASMAQLRRLGARALVTTHFLVSCC